MSARFNSGYNGKFTRTGARVRDSKPSQVWEIGAKVRVGFMKDLTVKEARDNGEYVLQSVKGAFYVFEPHGGIYRMESPSIS